MVFDMIVVHFFLLANFDWGKNAIIFGFDISPSVHTDNARKDIFLFISTQRLDTSTITAEAKYSINSIN